MARKFKILLIAIAALVVEYIICGYVSYILYFNWDVTKYMFFFCLLIVGIATICEKNRMVVCTVAGYALAFLMGILFNKEFIDTHGTTISTWYVWFVCSTVAMALAGAILEVFAAVSKNRSSRKK